MNGKCTVRGLKNIENAYTLNNNSSTKADDKKNEMTH